MFNRSISSLLKASSLALILLLAACGSTPPAPEVAIAALPPINQATKQPADFYLQQAKLSPELRFDWELRAAQAYYQQGIFQAGDAIIEELEPQAKTSQQQAGLVLIQSQAWLQQGKVQVILKNLDFDPLWSLTDDYWQSYHQLRIEAFEQLNQPLASAEERIALDRFLGEADSLDNLQHIWQSLKPLTSFTLRSFQVPGDELKNGWLEIVALSNEGQDQPQRLIFQLQQWKQDYPDHPAAALFSGDLAAAFSVDMHIPSKVAVILPLSGKYASNGIAIRDGLLAAFTRNDTPDWQPELQFYDSEQQSIADIYQDLRFKQAEFIVGPLLKSHLRELLALQPELPLLALNDVHSESHPQHYFFPLAPEDEAKQAAQHLNESTSPPLVLAPQSSVGKRMAEAFNQQWYEQQQQHVDVYYFNNRNDLQRAVKALLQTQQSQQRITQLKQILNTSLDAEVRSRADSDNIYIIGSNADLKLIKPFIDVTVSPFASYPALYASSRSYDKNAQSAVELNGMVFSEMPWMLDKQSIDAIMFNQLWPESSDNQKRMYGLGHDAYQLITQLAQLRHYPDYQVLGFTGTIGIHENGHIHRQLIWSEYQDGKLLPLEQKAEETTE